MVVLVIGSLIAFTGESLFTAGGNNMILLGVLLGTGLALIAGFQYGRPLEYAIGGAIAGGVIGFVMPTIVGRAGVESTLGTFDQKRIDELVSRRRAANDFVREVRRRALGFDFGGPPFLLAYQDPVQDVILGELLRAEADEIGIYVDDDAVNEFIDEQTARRLSTKDFTDVRERVTVDGSPISETELYELLRTEIKSKLALQTLVPFRDNDAVSPEMYWQLFRRLNVRQQLAYAAVPVEAFLDKVGEPTDSDIQDMFEKYKNVVPNQVEPGAPGFYQPRRIKLAYVEADYPTVESSIAAISDEEIEKYYEENKDLQFKKPVVPADPVEPDDSELPSLDNLGDPKPSDPTPSDPEPAGTNESDPGKAASGDPSGENSTAAPKATEKVNNDADQKANSEKTSDAGDGCEGFVQDADTQTGEPEQGTSDETTQTSDETKSGDQDPPTLTIPGSTEPPEDLLKAPQTEYMPLDADLREQIRSTLKRQRALEEIDQRIQGALTKMSELANERDNRFLPGATGNELSDDQICAELKKYADANGLMYAETPLVTANELFDREEFPIGSATAPTENQFAQRTPTVVQQLFGGGQSTALFEPARAELMAFEFGQSVNQFVYWAIGEIPPHEPKLDEAGIREQVVKAWKTEKARPLAEARAKELATQVTGELTDEKTMTDVLEKVTVTGDTDSANLVVSQTRIPFTWMQTSTAASPMSMQQENATLSNIPGVRGAGNEFMEYIFNELKPKEVGAVANIDKSTYYVVQPLNRFPSDESDEQALLERFLRTKHFEFTSPMPGLVRQQFGELNGNWLRSLEAKYGVDWGT